ncbi:MAG: hypothetical protein PVF17_01480 [Ignavibacteria bacterium]|jgi:hypothetical protein
MKKFFSTSNFNYKDLENYFNFIWDNNHTRCFYDYKKTKQLFIEDAVTTVLWKLLSYKEINSINEYSEIAHEIYPYIDQYDISSFYKNKYESLKLNNPELFI